MLKLKKNNLGFTLIELLIVIAILAILCFTIIPATIAVFSGSSHESSQIEVMSQEEEAELNEPPVITPSEKGDKNKL